MLTADGADRADVDPGDDVTVRVVAQVPRGRGRIVSVAWDLDGSGRFATSSLVAPGERFDVELRHAFTRPGTTFVTVRVAAQRDGDARTPFARVENLARARVVVRGPSS